MKILVVCLGNICRSPMADGLLRRKVKEKNLDFIIDSAGTSRYHLNEAPDTRMIEIGKINLTPIDFLRAREFKREDFDRFDRIYAMDKNNMKHLINMASNASEIDKIKLFLDHLYPNENQDVPDPFYGNLKDFQDVYDLLDNATNALLKDLINE